MRRRFHWALVFFLLGVGACDCGSNVTHHGDGGTGDGGHPMDGGGVDTGVVGDAGPPVDLGTDGPIDRMAFCMGMGPAVTVGDMTMGTATCAGAIASRVFNNSVCSCTDANVIGYMRTRSFHSGTMMSDTTAGAPVGIDQHDATGGFADIGGTLVVDGTSALNFGGYLKVGGDTKVNSDLGAIGYINIARDLWIEGNISIIGYVDVGRDVHQPSGHSILPPPSVGGSTSHAAFTIDPPCDCSPTGLVDIAAIVADGMAHNDNADIPLDPNLLAAVAGIGVDITLPCGRFYLNSVGGIGGITVHVTGRTALFIGGDVNAIGAFNIDIAPAAELDMFIGGNILSIGAGSFGSRSRPAASRIYVGGSGTVTLVGLSGFVGNVYAPYATITAVGDTQVYGSLFGNLIDMPGYLDVHYDRAILDVDRECDPPPTCDVCGTSMCVDHRACIGGACAACTSDADCCAPLICYPDGTCGSLLI